MDLDFYTDIFSTEHKVEKAVLKKHIEKLEELDQYLPRLQSFIMVQDTVNQSFEFVCDNYEKLLGYDKQDAIEQGMAFHFSKIHPEDIPSWMKILNDLMQHTMNHVERSDRINCVYYWNYRLKNAEGKYENIQVHQTPLFFDEQGKPILGYSQNTLTGNHKKQPMVGVCKKLNVNNEYETMFYKNYSETLLIDCLTNREFDVVRLLAKGLSTKEISSRLNISIHTTATHRKNILSKLQFNSSSEIINYCNQNQIF